MDKQEIILAQAQLSLAKERAKIESERARLEEMATLEHEFRLKRESSLR